MGGIRRSRQQGFSLLELSIVLVILGLLAGGTLAGQALIHAAEVRGGISDIEDQVVAYNMFRERYGCVPGDCIKSTRYFENVDNGDGNGLIDCAAPTGSCTAPTPEHVMARRSLNQAGLIRGGAKSTGTSYSPNKLRECQMEFYQQTLYEQEPANHIRVYSPLLAAPWNGDCMTPEDAYAIDSKLDDGNPSLGIVKSIRFTGNPQNECVSTNHWDSPSEDARYMQEKDGIMCSLFVAL